MRRGWGWAVVVVGVAGLAGCRDGERLGQVGAAFDVFPGQIDFGPTALGEQQRSTVRIDNRGVAPIQVTSITSTLPRVEVIDFAPFQIAAGDGRDVAVAFSPQVEGDFSGALQLRTDHEALGAQVPVSGQGVAALAELRTASVDFGVVELSTVKMAQLVVANPRAVPVQVQVALGGPDADEFSTAAARPLSLAPGEVRSVAVAFQPTRLGVAQASASVAVCPTCDRIAVPLGGSGIVSMLDISPLVVDFGRVPVGSAAEAHVTVRNLSSQPFDFRGASLLNNASGAFALTFVPALPNARLEAGMSVDLTLTFTPRASGPVPGVLLQINVSPAGSGAPGPKLPVLGAGGTPCLLVSPVPLDFGTVPQGMASTQWLQLSNRCRGQIQVSGQTLSTQVGGYFSLPAGATPIFLDGGAGARMAVSFMPRSGSTGSSGTLTLHVYQADGSGGTEQVPLLGVATTLPPCTYQLAPSALDFGSVPVGAAVTLGLSLHNTGTSACFVAGMQVAAGSDPELTAEPLGSRLLAPGAAATLRVRFQPAAEAAFAGLAEGWVNSSTAGHPTAPLAGLGTSSCFTLSPTTADFGLAKLGCPARSRAVIGYNRCSTAVAVGSAALDAAPGAPFALAGGSTGGISVPAGQSTTWTVRYSPSAEGDDAAALRVQALGSTFTAGLLGTARAQPTQTDHFVQQGQAKVDVLFVIDNSGSMMEEQASLAQNFAAFL
ncbi:MAG TPA: choice-of-anchor D domain-containing protein, partial [Myxococcales bacterium]|nr:choice-of-anchor D domain-containing protein [Myxococcales bacterium]